MTLNNLVNTIATKEDLANFIEQLCEDLQQRPNEWQNETLAHYLESMSAWIRAYDRYNRHQNLPVAETPTWKTLGEILLAAKYYE